MVCQILSLFLVKFNIWYKSNLIVFQQALNKWNENMIGHRAVSSFGPLNHFYYLGFHDLFSHI
jgi:hypothetical protein